MTTQLIQHVAQQYSKMANGNFTNRINQHLVMWIDWLCLFKLNCGKVGHPLQSQKHVDLIVDPGIHPL